MKENIKNKKILLAIVAVLTVIMLIIMAVSVFMPKQKISEINSKEMARAMTYPNVEEGEEDTDSEFVKFDAFFLRDLDNDGYAESIRGTCKEIGTEDTLYMELKVLTNGYLKNGKITINSNNFYFNSAIVKDAEIKNNYISTNIKAIELNQIENGTQKLLTGSVRSGNYLYSSNKAEAIGNDTKKYSQINSITLTGTHVKENEDGTTIETPIEKEVEFNIDWYGTTRTEIRNIRQEKNIQNIVDEVNKEINLEFAITTQEINNELILSKSYLEGTIPDLNGYKPTKVEITGRNITCTYNENTRQFTAQKIATINDNGIVTTTVNSGGSYGTRTNEYNLKVTYPLEAYTSLQADTIDYRVPIKAYYEGYNNTNKEFKNPYRSNIAENICVITFKNPQGTVAIFEVTVGKYVYSPSRYVVSKQKPLNIYNGISEEEKDDYYIVRWEGFTGTDGKTGKMIMKETEGEGEKTKDEFIKSDSHTESMEDITTNIGIYFSNPADLLGEDGEIKVYDDETDELLVTFNKSNWNKYSEATPYKYEVPVKHIRVETSNVSPDSSLRVYNVKELDDDKITKRYTAGEFENLKYIKSTLAGYLGEQHINTDIHQANYEEPKSQAIVSVSKSAITTQETYKNLKINIKTNSDGFNQIKWTNGAFLLKMPEDIIDIEINSVNIDNQQVKVTSYEQYEENGQRYIKINTENENTESYTITVDCNITPDPRIPTRTGTIELYAHNEANGNYTNPTQDIYDVNDNLNTEEKVNKSSTTIDLISPNSLLTSQTATNYDKKGSITIAPQTALVAKEQRKATIQVEIVNNYVSTISEVKILGRIPFIGNTYIINGEDMGSEFDVTMSNKGIELPEALQGVTKVYYSTNEFADKDLEDSENGWEENPADFTQVKSYLIDLQEKVLRTGESHKVSYEIQIPEGIDYNEKTYSHHSVYFSLDTENGKYKTQTEPNKLGVMIAKQYDLELIKFHKGTNKLVSGATYIVQDEEETRTRVTSENGKLTLKNLFVDKIYTIKELKTPIEYELNEQEIKFAVREEEGTLRVEVISGDVRGTLTTQVAEGHIAQIEVEDEVRANLKIVKLEQGTSNKVANVRYKLKGRGQPSSGRTLTTDLNGEINLKGLYIGGEYTLEEVKAEGYYIASPIKFTITNNSGNYTASVTQDSTTVDITATKENEIPTINLTLEDEKIPTYNLTIKKVEKGNESKLLAGAKFKLVKAGKEIGKYETAEDGTVTISNLYAYEDAKKLDQTYRLQEVLAPEGYSRIKDIEFKVTKNTDGTYSLESTEGTIANTQINGNNIIITLADSPSFKLIKTDEETGALLPNTKFVIYNVEDGQIPARNSKGELVGTKEVIDGKEYNIVTTNENGEITESLPEGLYKAVEVKASHDKYELAKAIYFGIGKSREVPSIIKTKWAQTVGSSNDDIITSMARTKDGGYIVGGYFYRDNIIVEGQTITNNGSSDGMLIKYNNNNEIVWTTSIGGSSEDRINTVSATEDGGYVVVGSFSGTITVGTEQLTSQGLSDGMIIKYNSNNQVQWAFKVGGTGEDGINVVKQTNDGGYIIGGYFSGSIDVGRSLTSTGQTDGIIVKYDENHQYEWAAQIGGNREDKVTTLTESRYGGYIVGGYFNSSSITTGSKTIDNVNPSSTYTDGMIIKYDSDGVAQKVIGIGGNSDDQITVVTEADDGGILVGGHFDSVRITVESDTVTNINSSGSYSDGLLIKYNSELNVEWKTTINGTYNDRVNAIVATSDGGYIVGGYFTEDVQLGDIEISAETDEDTMLIKYNSNNEVEWATHAGGDNTDIVNAVIEIEEGDYIQAGQFNSSSITAGEYTLENAEAPTYSNAMLMRYETKEVPNIVAKWIKSVGGTKEDAITSIELTEDGGYIAEGYFKSTTVNIGGTTLRNTGTQTGMQIKYDENNEIEWATTVDEYKTGAAVVQTSDGGRVEVGTFTGIKKVGDFTLTSNGNSDGMIVKYNSNDEVEWATSIGGSLADKINTVVETDDGGYLLGGSFSSTIKIGSLSAKSKGNADGMVIKVVPEAGVPEQEEIQVKNKIKSVKITTQVEEVNGVKGGTISGDGQKAYETVKYNQNSTKEVTMTPDSGYEIVKITINGEEVDFTKKADGSYTLPQFINMLEDKHIVVKYIKTSSKFTINKKDENGVTPIEGAKFIIQQVGGTTQLEVTTNSKGQAIVELPMGKFNITEIEAPEGYEKLKDAITYEMKSSGENQITVTNTKQGKIIVHHYILGTQDKVAEDENEYGKISDNYKTYPKLDLERYELAKDENGEYIIPSNASGKYKDEVQEITYYYTLKKVPLVVNHFIEETTTPVPLRNGEQAQTITSEAEEGEAYTTNALTQDELSEKYELVKMPENSTGTYQYARVEVIYYYRIKTYKITTKVENHTELNEKGEEIQVAGGTITGQDENPYETVEHGENSVKDIKAIPDEGYEVEKITVNGEEIEFTPNSDGTVDLDKFINMTEDKEVIVIFTNEQKINIQKTVTTQNGLSYVIEGEKITYTVVASNASSVEKNVLIKDNIPEGTTFVTGSIKVNDQNTYNEEDYSTKTENDLGNGITITVPKREQIRLSFEVTVNKLPEGTYEKQLANIATVNKNPEDPTSPDEPTNEVETPVKKPNITFAKESLPATNSKVKVGDEITYKIKVSNTGTAVAKVKIKDTIPEGTTFIAGSIKVDGKSSYELDESNVDLSVKTDEDLRQGIELKVEPSTEKIVEFKVTVNDIDNGTIIRNVGKINKDPEDPNKPDEPTNETEHEYVEPKITANKTIKTEKNLSYVIEGEKITYTVNITNDGGLAKDVIIKDNIPEGTTFVTGSIKINGLSSYTLNESTIDLSTKTAEDLANGLTVNVPEKQADTKGYVTVSFEVTVNKLPEGTYEKQIANTAVINKNPEDPTSPDEPTNEVETPVNKPNITFVKESLPVSNSKVKAGDEITYKIKIQNTGTAPAKVLVKDTIPTGTSFIENSIKLGNELQIGKSEQDLNQGIEVTVNEATEKILEFKVTVNDLENGTKIKNVGKVNKDPEDPNNPDEPTNETEHEYVEPIITTQKTITTQKAQDYVVEGEKITYKVIVKNAGGLEKDVAIKDSIPEGTTFVASSIKVNEQSSYELNGNIIDLSTKTANDLSNGIIVKVPEATVNADTSEKIEGQVILSFDVTVDKLTQGSYEKEILNIARVNKNPEDPETPDEPTNEVKTTVKKPNITYTKEAVPTSNSKVKAGDEITYKIKVANTGTEASKVKVKDTIPEGTTFIAESIKINEQSNYELNGTTIDLSTKTATDLVNGVELIVEEETEKVVEFKVIVNDINDGDTIRNVATVNKNPEDPNSPDEPTNETEHEYVEPIITSNKTFTTEKKLNHVLEGEKITYTVTVTNSGGIAKDIVIKDNIPEGTSFVAGSIKINETSSYVQNGSTIDLSTKTSEDLANGITVNVPEATQNEETHEKVSGQVTLSFEVTVNQLPEGVLTKILRNVATINKNPENPDSPDEPTNEVTTTVNKSNVTFEKESVPASGEKVKANDEITYRIKIQNSGTANSKVKVKDSIPTGTTYVENSIKITREALARIEYTKQDLEQGITFDLQAQEKVTIEFKVTVNNLEDGAIIRNVAMVNNNPEDPENPDVPTNETTHIYVKPIISSRKIAQTENKKNYVISGEKITYTVQISNTGSLAEEVTIKDNIPEQTTFVPGSIKVNGASSYELNGEEIDLSVKTVQDIKDGITINVPEAKDEIPGVASLSFEVTVNKDVTGNIENTALVDDIPTNTVKNPIVTYEKVATVIRKENASKDETTLQANEVTVGDKIKYTIRVNNTGNETIENIIVEDTIPEGTKLDEIKNSGTQEGNKITWTIESIAMQISAEVSFTVEVEYAKEEYTIRNVAVVDGKETNETENPYKKPEPDVESKVEKTATGDQKVTSKETSIYYEIQFTATVKDFVGKAKVTIVDNLPYKIDEANSELRGGTYNSENKTITWVEEIEDIDTFIVGEAKQISILKQINLKYIYENLNSTTGKVVNTVNTKIELQEPKTENPTEYETVKEDEKQDDEELPVEIPANVIVHHYIYDEENNQYTTIKLTEDETQEGIIGNQYTTSPSNKVPANYTVVNETPDKYTGKMTEETIEVIYYYKLTTPTVENEIDKTAEANKEVEETVNGADGSTTKVKVPVLTKEGGVVTYNIVYNAHISNYIGKVAYEIVDTLPAKIDVENSDLKGGIYNEVENTITWNEIIENVDTYANQTGTYEGGEYNNGTYTKQIEKQIKLVYIDQSPVIDLKNEVTGKTKVYYPEKHPKEGEEQIVEEAKDEETVKQEYTVKIKLQKVWEDNSNLKQKRPTSIKVEVKETQSGDKIEVELNEENNWTYEIESLPKYNKETAKIIEYEVVEKEVNKGDLEYYESPVIVKTEEQIMNQTVIVVNNKTQVYTEIQTEYTYTITNEYKLLDTDLKADIIKEGTKEITSSSQNVDYTIHFTAEIADYIGSGKVTIVDTLPYKIDETKSNLKGGIYNDELKTITWIQELPHINTDTLGRNYKVDIEKQISVVYKDLDTTKTEMINTVKGKIELYETEQKDEAEDDSKTEINLNGTVKVKYVDIKTGKEIADRETIDGKVGTPYETDKKAIEGYEYVKDTNNTKGTIKEGEQEVIYYYKSTDTKVIVEYIDEDGNKLIEDIIKEGKVGDEYNTEEKEFDGYELVKVPDNKEGKMTEDEITVTYIYKKIPARVIVKYLEKGTEKELLPEETIEGYVNDKYDTQRKVVPNYKATEPEPNNSKGNMIKNIETNNTITVIYYYEKIPSGTVTVKYVDIDTGKEITYIETKEDENGEIKTEEKTYRYEITGNAGDKYKTEQKDIPYYKLVKVPANAVGELTENGDTVIYYYQKKAFNISVEKELEKIVFNGQEKIISNKKAMKIEIVASKIKQASLEVTYAIRVRNTGELDGTAKVVEMIPQGYSVTENTPKYWAKSNDGTLTTTVNLKAGEEKLLLITLKWINSDTGFGSSSNTVKVTDTSNPANFRETTLEDNQSSAEIIVSVKTGGTEKTILIGGIIALVSIAIIIFIYLYRKIEK